jgi:hypothetical protein
MAAMHAVEIADSQNRTAKGADVGGIVAEDDEGFRRLGGLSHKANGSVRPPTVPSRIVPSQAGAIAAPEPGVNTSATIRQSDKSRFA